MAARILAIDDDGDLLELYRLILTDEGYDVHLCHIGADAYRQVRALDPAVVILDGHIATSAQGGKLFTLLIEEEACYKARLLLCSADSRLVQERGKLLASIGGAVLGKPFNIDELLDLVTRLSAPREART